jgi:hypothetical protein
LSPITDTYTTAKVNTSRYKSVVFLKELSNVEYHTVPEEAFLPLVQDTRRNLMKHKLILPNMHCVPRVRASLVPCHDVHAFRENIHNLPLAFITPLTADYYRARPLSSHTSSTMESRVLGTQTYEKTGSPHVG